MSAWRLVAALTGVAAALAAVVLAAQAVTGGPVLEIAFLPALIGLPASVAVMILEPASKGEDDDEDEPDEHERTGT